MPRLQVTISLPYLLRLNSGLYSTGQLGQELEIHQRPVESGIQADTLAIPPTSEQAESGIWEMTVIRDYPTVVSFTSDQLDTADKRRTATFEVEAGRSLVER